jgi:hypothetical protein
MLEIQTIEEIMDDKRRKVIVFIPYDADEVRCKELIDEGMKKAEKHNCLLQIIVKMD